MVVACSDRGPATARPALSALTRTLPCMAAKLPVHVWVREAASEAAGLLVAWEHRPDGSWWGRVLMLDSAGEPAVAIIRAHLLRLASADST